MKVITFRKLREYFEKDPKARVAFQDWYLKVKKANWKNFSDVKKTFNSVDNVGGSRYVFNVKGKYYRIITTIRYNYNRVYIRWVGAHAEYDRLKNIDKI